MKITANNTNKRICSQQNKDLFKKVKDVLKKSAKEKYESDFCYFWHIGLHDIGNLVDWLEENYELKEKD